jgi:hypothetical protein
MTEIKSLVATAVAAFVIAGCAGPEPEPVSPEQREALNEEMLKPDTLTGGYMAGQGIGNF